jgi:hypothetical protein
MNLDSIIKENLDILLGLKNDDKLKTVDNKLIIDNEENSFQELNSPNLELVILNTFSMAFYLETNNLTEKDDLLNIINTCIDNVYNNEYLHKEDSDDSDDSKYTFFNDGLQKINHVYRRLRNKYQRNKCNRFYYKFFELIDILLNESIIICKSINETVIEYHHALDNSDDELDDSDVSDLDDSDLEDSDNKSNDNSNDNSNNSNDSNDSNDDSNCSDIDITFIDDKKLV